MRGDGARSGAYRVIRSRGASRGRPKAATTPRAKNGRGRGWIWLFQCTRVYLRNVARAPALRGLALTLLGFAACIGVRQLEVPPNDGARSVLIIFRDANETVVYAADVTST